MKKLSVDPGKYGCKAVTKDMNGNWQYFYFKSKIKKNPMDIVGGENYLVTYENQDYLLGEGADDYSLDISKQSIQHKLSTYLSISQLAKEEPCKIVVGCPFNFFKNSTKREEYTDYLKDNKLIQFAVNKEEVLINIDELAVFPECAGIAFSESEEDFIGTIRAVIDIGGLNVNGCVFDNLNPISETVFTVNKGSIILRNKLKNELNKEFCLNLQDHEIPNILKKRLTINGRTEDKANKIIERVLGQHIEEILREAKMRNWCIETLNITFGGSITFLIQIANRT